MVGWYFVGVLGLALLMVVHEAGHYFAARAYGMRVLKFSIGFGPTFFKVVPKDGYFWFTTAADKIRLRLWRHDPVKHGPTVFQVAMIPFLAYVQIAGMNPMEEVDPEDKGSYANASLVGRIAAIFAGPLANYVFASVLFFASLMTGGKHYRQTEIGVVAGTPAAAANLKDGDRIVEIDGTPVQDWEKMAEIISRSPGRQLDLVIERGSERIPVAITPASDNGSGRIGVTAIGPIQRAPVTAKEAAVLALTKPPKVVQGLIVGLGQVITGRVEGELGGPKRMIEETAYAAKRGWADGLEFLGMLSAYLGAFNLIPFPALDGGRLMFLFYEATTRRRPNARIEAHIHLVGVFMLIGLMLYVTANDFGLGSK
ncbi:zinc metalloprotease [Sorangium cellulosum]|uniref:Zinc metalloprotease n=1 Tax=Sorangium cellulosum TaxID=56 RepID=A0A2L0F8U0_SORCE|nr:M50 family metallopeptidase [Sorangium cellulosum]AUX47922.1 zinc metalloprotease [Sorangium cellulosum]